MNRKVRVIYWSRSWPVVKPLTPILELYFEVEEEKRKRKTKTKKKKKKTNLERFTRE